MFAWISLNLLQRHVLKQVFIPFLSGVAVFLFILMSLQLFMLSEMILVHDFSIGFILKILGLICLKLMPIVVPISFLFAVLMSISKMSSDSELIAMQALGLSLYSILKPILYLSIIVSFLVIWCNLELVPLANRTLKDLVIKASSTKAISQIKPKSFTSGFFDLVIFTDSVNSKENSFKKVFIYDSRTEHHFALVGDARTLIPIYTNNPFESNSVLQINDGSIFFKEKEHSDIIHFGSYQINLSINQSDAEAALKPNYLTLKELRQRLKDPPSEKEKILFELELHTRFSIGFGCIVFSLLGLAFGITPPRGLEKSSTLISIIVLISYYLFSIMGGQLAEKGFISPIIITWMPNILTLGIGWLKFNQFRKSLY